MNMITVFMIVLTIIIVLTLVWLFCIAPATPRGDFSELKKFDYAHRGLHKADGSVPENSLTGFKAAVQAGYGIEWDLQLTKDEKVVVHHDRSLKRLCGVDVSIGDLTFEELQQFHLLNTDERVPLFSEALAVVGGKTPLIIELKGYDKADRLCPLVWEILKDYKGNYCIESFDTDIVAWFRKNQPDVLRGQLMGYIREKNVGFGKRIWGFFMRNLYSNVWTRPHFEAYELHERNTPSLRTACNLLKMQEANWTIRSEEEYKICKNAGSLCIFENIRP